MGIGRMHEMLAEISGCFSLDILAREDTSAKIRTSLARHGKLAQRHSPLQPVLVAWLVLAMTLCRDKSIPNVLASLIAAVRGERPALSLKPVTGGALSHARERMGAAPLRSFFGALAGYARERETLRPPRGVARSGGLAAAEGRHAHGRHHAPSAPKVRLLRRLGLP